MEIRYRKGAAGALMDEYEKAVSELEACIRSMSDEDLTIIVDTETTDANCSSVQTILSHVISAAYSYVVYIQNATGINAVRPDKKFHTAVSEYLKDLKDVMLYTASVFNRIKDSELEQFDNSKKISATWGQMYDIEQLAEHAIVHVLRHRRQIEKFKIVLQSF